MTSQERLNQVAKKQENTGLRAQLESESFLEFVGSIAPGLDPLAVARVAYAHVQASPYLAKCSAKSIIQGVAEAAKLGFTVDGVLGHAYLVPYGGQAKMMVGYRGFVALGYASDKVVRWHWDTIHENDEFRYAEGVSPTLDHRPALNDRGAVIGAYAVAHLANSPHPLVCVMGMDEIEARRAKSASYKRDKDKSPWGTDFEAMARKCPVRELSKRLPLPILQAAALRDEARDEDRDDAPSAIDLGDADVLPENGDEGIE